MNSSQFDVIVIGAGVSGLTAAALLAADGARVLLLEHHYIVGGCASFFQRSGYRFDVGATVAGGFGPRGLHTRIAEYVDAEITATRIDPAMVVHLAGEQITRYGDERWKNERLRAFGPHAERFWTHQEHTADAAWSFAANIPALPVDLLGMRMLARAIRPSHVQLLTNVGRSVAQYLPADEKLRRFVDAQLLITAQADAANTDWLYGATALDLAREGTYHVVGGIATIATSLVRAFRKHGGTIIYRATVHAIETDRRGRVIGASCADGRSYFADRIISAIPVADTAAFLPEKLVRTLQRKEAALPRGYGAFTAYVGLPPGIVPEDFPGHHQVVRSMSGPMGEGRTAFVSFSAQGDTARARDGGRAVTLSTHTDPLRWEQAYRDGSYDAERDALGAQLLAVLEDVLPGSVTAARTIEFGTPYTFYRYTARARGYVGGSPQKPWLANLFAHSHRSGVRGLTLCGDSVFPGQSTVGAALSGTIAAKACGSNF